MLVTKACHGNLGLVVLVVSREACLGPPTALRRGTGVPWVSLLGPTSVPQAPTLCVRLVRLLSSCLHLRT